MRVAPRASRASRSGAGVEGANKRTRNARASTRKRKFRVPRRTILNDFKTTSRQSFMKVANDFRQKSSDVAPKFHKFNSRSVVGFSQVVHINYVACILLLLELVSFFCVALWAILQKMKNEKLKKLFLCRVRKFLSAFEIGRSRRIPEGLRGWEFCTICPFFAHFSTFTKISQVPSFQSHSPVKTVFRQNAKNARKSQNTPSTNPYQNETQFSPFSLKSRTSGHPDNPKV